MEYSTKLNSKTFKEKSSLVQDLIENATFILETLGIPISDLSSRRLERMAMSFLAVGDIKNNDDFSTAKHAGDKRSLKTREIIAYINKNFEEDMSPGSYDDIRRKDLRLLILGGIAVQTSPNSARNDSTRGYALSTFHAELLQDFTKEKRDVWAKNAKEKLGDVELVSKKLDTSRQVQIVPVKLPDGTNLEFSNGKHNDLQKAIIEEFLPRYGYGAEVLYVGDTADKFLHLNKAKLSELNFFELSHGELPDVIAYSESKNWLYLIEAVHSSGPISEIRLSELKALSKKCVAGIVYVTAFLDKQTFRKFSIDIAWETEVWIAENPDHLIHLNGDKFMGPYTED